MAHVASLRRRLVVQMIALAAILALILYVTVRAIAYDAAEAAQDAVLGAATAAIADELRYTEGGIDIDLPYATFSMLGAIGEDRLFYRIDLGDETATGYDDLPRPAILPDTLAPAFYSQPYRGEEVRFAAVARPLLSGQRILPVLVIVGQTRTGQIAIAEQMANRAVLLGLGFFAVAVPLSLLVAGAMLRPVDRLAVAVGRRGPDDLRDVEHPVPRELAPLIQALNGLMARLSAALNRTETFIAEAAHHIRTPLSTVRSEAEIALRHVDSQTAAAEALRARLRAMIRAVDESSRSANQLLDHAAMLVRADQPDADAVDLGATLADAIDAMRPTASLKDIQFVASGIVSGVTIRSDRMLIDSALRNMLDNAVKYSPPDATVSVTMILDTGSAAVAVRDQGRGLGGAGKADLVQRFKRGDNVGDVVGSGLGLTIVDGAATALGGRFEIGDNPEGGTCATLVLPLR